MCLYLGPLVALILYYNLLEWVRKDLKTIRHVLAVRAAHVAAGTPSV